MGVIYKAHINEKTRAVQTIKEHAEGTAELAAAFAIPKLKELSYQCGMLHDIGKVSDKFQRRIDGANIRVEHSACGAIEAKKLHPNAIGLLMAYCIAGHHSGLPDGGSIGDRSDGATLQARLHREYEDYSAYRDEILPGTLDDAGLISFLIQHCGNSIDKVVDQFAFWVRYVYSCLVDADWIDTSTFCEGEAPEGLHADFRKALALADQKLGSFVCKTNLQKSRAELQEQVFRRIGTDAEIYLMNMPTGSGKTLCSVKAALERVLKGEKKRIIYICPFNAIIDQTAQEFTDLFGDSVEILRHQSTFSYEDEEDLDEDYRKSVRHAVENWDAQFIITTAVQFFESINGNRRGKLRKMHHVADAVLVFDEAHLMPRKYLQPCLQAVAYITKYLNSEAMFLTATMPDFERLIRRYAMEDSRIYNLVEDKSLFGNFQKCRFCYEGKMPGEQVLRMAEPFASALVVVNRKATTRELYRMAAGKKYHLSTYMTALDRERIIAEVRDALRKLEEDFPDGAEVPEERRIIVFSTSLVEAGVDLDFATVFREMPGLDSILQAGGRCNREGKRTGAEVHIFEYDREDGTILPDRDERAGLTRGLLEEFEDISCPESIRTYYDRLYFINEQEIQQYAMHKFCRDINSIPFREYAERFRIVDAENTVSVVVPQDDKCKQIVELMRTGGKANARQMQKYTCTVGRKEFDDLYRQGAVCDYGTSIWCLTNTDYYDRELGIYFEGKDYIL